MSPVIWNLIFDDFLGKFDQGPVTARGFANDACLLIKGPDPNSMIDIMKNYLIKATEWSNDFSLEFNAQKTEVMLFQGPRLPKSVKKLSFQGVSIDFASQVKYLGIMLDPKLNFNIHITNRVAKAKALLFALKGAVGKY